MVTFKEKIENIISQSECSKNFKCYQSNYANLCKVRYIGEGKNLLECIDEDDLNCEFSIHFKGLRNCGCRVRALIALELGM